MMEHHSTGFGETLRRRREQQGLSLNDVAVRTRVRKAYLQALEDENLSMLPGAAYAVGFLRIYARHLELDARPLIAALTGKAVPDATISGAESGVAPRGRVRRGTFRWLPVLLVASVLLGAVYLYYLQHQPEAPVPSAPAPAPVVVTPAVPAPAPALPVVPAQPPVPAASTEPAVAMVDLPVLPLSGAVVRVVAAAAGTLKVTLDGQESRVYEVQPEQPLNWKVGRHLQLELSAPALIRCWVNDQEIALAEQTAVSLVPAPSAPAPRQ